MNFSLLLMPFVSALTGWVGSWLAGRIFIYSIIPRYQSEIARQAQDTINREFSFEQLGEKINDPSAIKKIMPLVEDHIDDFLRNKLKEKMPVIGMFISDKIINSMKGIFLKEIEEIFPRVLKQFTANLQQELNIGGMAAAKVEAIPASQWAKTLSPVLNYFRITGTITGLVIGIVCAAMAYFLL